MNTLPLLNWMRARHDIYLARAAGLERPWTEDTVLQNYKFTNVFRDLDRVSIELLKHLDANSSASKESMLFNICAYRMFNWPDTWQTITDGRGWIRKWNMKAVKAQLDERKDRGEKIFTGAYMMTGSGSEGSTKHRTALFTLDKMHTDKRVLTTDICNMNSIEYAVKRLSQYRMVSGFVAYEFATDFTYCKLLPDPCDLMTWANPGPGSRRGLNRLLGRELGAKLSTQEAINYMVTALKDVSAMWPFDRQLVLRDIEHSLCEFDKYERVRLGEGKPRGRYNGT